MALRSYSVLDILLPSIIIIVQDRIALCGIDVLMVFAPNLSLCHETMVSAVCLSIFLCAYSFMRKNLHNECPCQVWKLYEKNYGRESANSDF